MRILTRHRGRTAATWVLTDQKGTVKIVKATLVRIGSEGYTYLASDGRVHALLTVRGPEELEKSVLRWVKEVGGGGSW